LHPDLLAGLRALTPYICVSLITNESIILLAVYLLYMCFANYI